MNSVRGSVIGDKRGFGSPRVSLPAHYNNFLNFHRQNPHVYDLFKRMALKAKAAGRKRYSIRTIAHIVRWHLSIETKEEYSDFKINNNQLSFYARELMANEPELDGFFEIRGGNQ